MAKASVHRPLRRGNKGADVTRLQREINFTLKNRGFRWRQVRVDGRAGEETFAAVHMAGWLQGFSEGQLRKVKRGTLTTHAQRVLRHSITRSAAMQKRERGRRKEAATLRRKHRRRANWPKTATFAELLYHDPPHLHIAMCDRDKLIAICRIAENKYGLRVGEFPPFDVVEAVHVSGSWHYRQSGQCSVPRNFSNRGDGLAGDLNGAREYEFYLELRRRYA